MEKVPVSGRSRLNPFSQATGPEGPDGVMRRSLHPNPGELGPEAAKAGRALSQRCAERGWMECVRPEVRRLDEVPVTAPVSYHEPESVRHRGEPACPGRRP